MVSGNGSSALAYSVQEASELIGLSKDMIYELCRRGEFPHIRVGNRKIIIPKRRLEAWLDGGILPPAEPTSAFSQ